MKPTTSKDIARMILDENVQLPIQQSDYKNLAIDYLKLFNEDYS